MSKSKAKKNEKAAASMDPREAERICTAAVTRILIENAMRPCETLQDYKAALTLWMDPEYKKWHFGKEYETHERGKMIKAFEKKIKKLEDEQQID